MERNDNARETIFAAADALVADGKKPTLAAVLTAIGRGSSTTVNKYMQEWRGERQPSAPVAPANAAPPAVADKGARFINDLWSAALELANEGLTADRAELDRERAEIHGQLQETAEYADQQAEKADRLTTEVEKLSAKLEQESHEHASTHQLLEGALRDNVRLESQYNNAIDRQQELKAEVAELVERHKQTNAAREKAEKQATTNAETLAEVRARHEMTRERADRAEGEKLTAEERASSAEVHAAELAGELKALRAQLALQAELIAKIAPPAAAPIVEPKPAKSSRKATGKGEGGEGQ